MVLTNQLFCYWLQGYFEITENPILTKDKIKIIEQSLAAIQEPLGIYTSWLKDVLYAISINHYNDNFIQYFTPIIKVELNNMFLHIIDNSYTTAYSSKYLKSIHDGK